MDHSHLCRCHTNIHHRLVQFAIDACSIESDHPMESSSMPSTALYRNKTHSCDRLSHTNSRAMSPASVVACVYWCDIDWWWSTKWSSYALLDNSNRMCNHCLRNSLLQIDLNEYECTRINTNSQLHCIELNLWTPSTSMDMEMGIWVGRRGRHSYWIENTYSYLNVAFDGDGDRLSFRPSFNKNTRSIYVESRWLFACQDLINARQNEMVHSGSASAMMMMGGITYKRKSCSQNGSFPLTVFVINFTFWIFSVIHAVNCVAEVTSRSRRDSVASKWLREKRMVNYYWIIIIIIE